MDDGGVQAVAATTRRVLPPLDEDERARRFRDRRRTYRFDAADFQINPRSSTLLAEASGRGRRRGRRSMRVGLFTLRSRRRFKHVRPSKQHAATECAASTSRTPDSQTPPSTRRASATGSPGTRTVSRPPTSSSSTRPARARNPKPSPPSSPSARAASPTSPATPPPSHATSAPSSTRATPLTQSGLLICSPRHTTSKRSSICLLLINCLTSTAYISRETVDCRPRLSDML